jgi:hypothetical protein
MGRPDQSLLVLALGILAALAIASCGGGDAQLLPGETARDITANLNTVRDLADAGDCVGAESAAQQVSEQIAALGGIDAKLKRALEQGAARLNEVVASCEEAEGEETTTTTTPPETEGASEKTAKKEEKEREKEEREREKEEGQSEKNEGSGESPSTPPAPAQGEAKGHGDEPAGGEEGGGEDSSGGVGPGTPLEGES